MDPRTVRIHRYPDSGHAYAEWGAVPRTVGNVSPNGAKRAYEWSSLEAEGMIYTAGGLGFGRAIDAMVEALRREGFAVDTEASHCPQSLACPSCGTWGQRGCAECHGTGRVWTEQNVLRFESE